MATNANPPRGALGPAPKAKDPAVPPPLASSQYGGMKTPDPRYLFGTDEEIFNRDATGYKTVPSHAAPAFKQIVAGPTSKDLNAPAPTSRQGNSKFGSPRKYA